VLHSNVFQLEIHTLFCGKRSSQVYVATHKFKKLFAQKQSSLRWELFIWIVKRQYIF